MKIFSSLPASGVREDLEWKTNVLRMRDGSESRFSLREFPRKKLTASFGPISNKEKPEFSLLISKVGEAMICPEWQYGSILSQGSVSSSNRIYFDPSTTELTVGRPVAIINPFSGGIITGRILTMELDGAILEDVLPDDVLAGYIVCAASEMQLDNQSAIKWDTVTGSAEITLSSIVEYTSIRSDNSQTIGSFDSLLLFGRVPDQSASEEVSFNQLILDNEVGQRQALNRDSVHRVAISRTFTFSRFENPGMMDWFRKFFNSVKGGWKSFLCSTLTNDFRLYQNPANGSTFIRVYGDLSLAELLRKESHKRIHIQYGDGTEDYRVISSTAMFSDDVVQINLGTALPNNSKVQNIQVISLLLRVTFDDTISILHENRRSTVEVDMRTVLE